MAKRKQVFAGELAARIHIPKDLDADAAQAHYLKECGRKFELLMKAMSQVGGLVWPRDAADMFMGFVMTTVPGFQIDASRRGPEQKKWTPEMKLSLHQDFFQVKTKNDCQDTEALEHLRTEQPYKARWGGFTLANLKSRLPEAKALARGRAKALGRVLREMNSTATSSGV